MQVYRLNIEILASNNDSVVCCVSLISLHKTFTLDYDVGTNQLNIVDAFDKAFVVAHQEELKKILRSAVKGGIACRRNISAVLMDDFPFLPEEAYNKYIRLFYTEGHVEVDEINASTHNAVRIMADGSYNAEKQCGGYAGFVQYGTGPSAYYVHAVDGGSSNTMELLAVLDALRRLKEETLIQINTDSRYVIRGMIQWMHYWYYNNWQTAYCTPVVNGELWQEIYALCRGKVLELKWIKGHVGHVEHTRCHQLAQQAAKF